MAPTNLETLSTFLGFAPQHLFFLTKFSDRLYFEFRIPKSNGSERIIRAPRSELKGVQREILKKILEKESVSESCFAYVKKRSVVQAATALSGHKAVLHLDIKDFFPTIDRRRVFGLYRSLGYNNKVSYILSRLCTADNQLCQGAPTSPYLSNLIFRRADRQIASACAKFKLSYVRYSDDLFICGIRDFRYERLAEIVANIVNENGFAIQPSKTRYFRRNSHRYTLGLQTTGKKAQLPREVRRNYRAAFHKASRNLKWGQENLSVLSGMAEWYRSVCGGDNQYRDYKRVIANVRSLKLHDVYIQS